ncbi:hypothetical protein X975_26775, partial [Stegodyphus mimosarum]
MQLAPRAPIMENMGKGTQHSEHLWNFKKADWKLFEDLSNDLFSQEPLSDDLEGEWSSFKCIIFKDAKATIPRGEHKRIRTRHVHKEDPIQTLLVKRDYLLKITRNGGMDKRIELNKLNAEIKRNYVIVKRTNWQNLSKSLDYRSLNTELWNLAKKLDQLKPGNEDTNAIIDDNSHVSMDDRDGADALAKHYAKVSRLNFKRSDKILARTTRNQIKSYCDVPTANRLFNRDFTLSELLHALQNLDPSKTPGPDGVHGHFLCISVPWLRRNFSAYLTCLGTDTSFNHVTIREELLTNIVKGNHHAELLRQMALEILNDIPAQALVIYTDGSRSDKDRAGSSIYSNTPEGAIRCSIKNSDHCSVFRSELIAISKALDYALCSSSEIIWILTDSRSSSQYLKNWPKMFRAWRA